MPRRRKGFNSPWPHTSLRSFSVNTMDLASKKCIPCETGISPLDIGDVGQYLKRVPGWVYDGTTGVGKITRDFKFRDFKEAMVFVNKVAEIAEAEGHHPDIHIFYNQVRLDIWTHAANGLTENDFVLAAKVNSLA